MEVGTVESKYEVNFLMMITEELTFVGSDAVYSSRRL
jgi:hypothetical protein